MAQCKKCNKKIRSKRRPYCMECYLDKTVIVWSGHTQDDIEWLVEICKIWLFRLEVTQRNLIDMDDLNDIINYHWEIFHREYAHEMFKPGIQFSMMVNDIKKFICNYDKPVNVPKVPNDN